MYILTDNLINSIVSIGSSAEVQLDKYVIDGVTYYEVGTYTLHDVGGIAEDIQPYKYCYTVEKGFYLNEFYGIPNQLEYELISLRNQVDMLTLMMLREGE